MGRGTREARSVPFSSLAAADEHEPAVEPERFRRPGQAFAGNWTAFPGDWSLLPEEKLLGRETLEIVKARDRAAAGSAAYGDHHARRRRLQR